MRKWTPWFAWYPILTDDNRFVFLRTIWRRERERDIFGSLEFPPSRWETMRDLHPSDNAIESECEK